ncbi:nitrogen regulation protein NR(II) [Marinibaculum pumilum]|uniref:histidine kinase n=1 Tax=Marinibaculum pumilum TaxID=1766165 RepID=A0ABV7KU95_9PROT
MARAKVKAFPVHDRAEPNAVLAALPNPILVVSGSGEIRLANPAAEEFFESGAAALARQNLSDLVPFGSPILTMVAKVISDGYSMSEYGVVIGSPKLGERQVNLQLSPIPESPGQVVLQIEQLSVAQKLDRQLTHRGAARSVVGIAAMLAHEVKNPLSGIRGAAQLLELSVPAEERHLTKLICDEADRIVGLVDRMEVFSDERPVEKGPVNIHDVLEHVRKVAQAGFARRVRFVERYDPSLPPVLGARDQLIQVFLNLVKNAAEAVPEDKGEITLSTAYRHGLRLSVPGSRERLRLPLQVCVTDNGPGVPEDLLPYLFDPFVTTKRQGSGLGLAMVAKVIGDHGGVIECDSRPRRTRFEVNLPLYEGGGGGGEAPRRGRGAGPAAAAGGRLPSERRSRRRR